MKEVTYSDDLTHFDYTGTDQSEIAQFCLANDLLDQIFKTYSALTKVQKVEGQNIAKQILETCTGPFKELFAAI